MRDPLNKTITTIQPSGIRKFFDVVHEMKDAISLGVGEPDFDTPWHIRDEGIYSLEKERHTIHPMPDSKGIKSGDRPLSGPALRGVL